jgi:hypothetical protein
LRALGVPVFEVTSLLFHKEVTKKGNQGVPPWIPLSVPRCKAKDEIDISLACAVLQDSHHARQAKNQKFSIIVERMGEGPRRLR